jgi:hypothetical protein
LGIALSISPAGVVDAIDPSVRTLRNLGFGGAVAFGRSFFKPSTPQGSRIFQGTDGSRLVRSHLFYRLAQGRRAGKMIATRGLATL